MKQPTCPAGGSETRIMADKGAPPSVTKEVYEALGTISSEEGFSKPIYQVELGSEAGDGYTSVLYRITIQDEDASGRADAPLTVMCKTLPERAAAGSFKDLIFLAEGLMYETALPALEEVASLGPPLPWPRCLRALVDGPSLPLLMLEDLRPEGFRMADRRELLDPEHCRLALTQLARFHGSSMALKHLKPHVFKAISDKLRDPSEKSQMNALFTQVFAAAKSAPDIIQDKFPEGSKTRAKLQEIFAKFTEDFYRAVEMDGEVGTGIVHGDCHSNNVMFQYDKQSGAVTGCRLIDFQCTRVGHTACDVASLLLPATDKAARAAHWQGLLRHYHVELQATLRAAGCPEHIYSWDQFMDCLRSASGLGLVMTPLFVQVMYGDPAAIKEVKDSVDAINNAAANEAPAPIPLQMKATPLMKERFGDLVQDMVDWGWLPRD
ncbi:hypothetical protein ONE63_005177 [Megalurothrips usitatus]|uniref:CHK kinase-like domain-containing protein n=1 Tax=Megalurothrips usitatus TaxID=439358 RepID=A0AAV7XV61_9NEOP|nr:hypothetical protein ONE63_005177 [Megalurothrips usitatus]